MLKAIAIGAGMYGIARAVRQLSLPSFSNRVVLITGGSRGLGLAMARRLARENAMLSLVARTGEDLEEVRKELREAGTNPLILSADLSRKEEAERVVRETVEHFGSVHVLIHNAGVIQVGPIDQMDDEDFHEAMDVHFWAAYHLTRAAIPYLERHDFARIVNIASVGGEVAVPHMAPYSASKFALVGYSDGLRAELAPRGIKVTTVSPGLMRTGSHVNATFKSQREKEYAWFSILAGNPLLSTTADRAARRIIEACRAGRPNLVITIPAKLAKAAEGVAPNLVARANELVHRLLPEREDNGSHAVPGHELDQPAPKPLTHLADRNVDDYNEER